MDTWCALLVVYQDDKSGVTRERKQRCLTTKISWVAMSYQRAITSFLLCTYWNNKLARPVWAVAPSVRIRSAIFVDTKAWYLLTKFNQNLHPRNMTIDTPPHYCNTGHSRVPAMYYLPLRTWLYVFLVTIAVLLSYLWGARATKVQQKLYTLPLIQSPNCNQLVHNIRHNSNTIS